MDKLHNVTKYGLSILIHDVIHITPEVTSCDNVLVCKELRKCQQSLLIGYIFADKQCLHAVL